MRRNGWLCQVPFCPPLSPASSIDPMKSKIVLLFDHATGELSIQADNMAEGEAAYFCLMRVLAAAQNVICDHLEEKRLVIAKVLKPVVRTNLSL